MADEPTTDKGTQDKPTDKGASMSDFVAKEKELESMRLKLETLETKEKERLESEKRRSQMDADSTKKALAETEQRAQELADRIKAFEQRNIERAQQKIEALPEEEKARISKWKEKMSVDDWVSFVEEEHDRLAVQAPERKSAMPSPSPVDKAGIGGKGMKMSELGRSMLEQVVGDHDRVLEIMNSETAIDESTNQRRTVFTSPINKVLGAMRKARPKNLSREEALKGSRV